MIPAAKHAARAARAVIRAFTGTGLAQESVAADPDDATAGTDPRLSALCRRAAAEGCVLLANDGTLPLATDERVAVFGRRQLDWVHMGNGSGGDVNAPYLANLLDGMDDVGASYDRVLAQTYRAWCADARHAVDPGFWGHWPQSLPEMPVSPELARAAAADARCAIVVIGRAAGEDQDLAPTPGGYYLTDDEHQLLATVTGAFEHTVVVLDLCNPIDLSWAELYEEGISAMLVAWAGGMEAGCAAADVLWGRVNPAGRLTDAWAKDLQAHPSSATFGQTGSQAYTEGVFVGQRHFGTYAPRDVRFALGHGLSYTSFEVEGLSCELVTGTVRKPTYSSGEDAKPSAGSHATTPAASELTVPDEAPATGRTVPDEAPTTGRTVPGPGTDEAPTSDRAQDLHCEARLHLRVTNTGPVAGRNAVVLWCEAPRGTVTKPLQVVAAFAKTATLAPSASEELALVANLDDIAVFDEVRRAFVLEQGFYIFRANETPVGKAMLTADVVYERLEPICVATDDLRERILAHVEELHAKASAQAARAASDQPDAGITTDPAYDGWASAQAARAASDRPDTRQMSDPEPFAHQAAQATGPDDSVARPHESIDVSKLGDAELEALTRGAGTMNVAFGPAGNAGAFGGTTDELRDRGVPPVICADGPSGARLAQRCALLPCACALASSWDTELVRELYACVGLQIAQAGVDVLLAPGMNLHRSPLCGRNFEYFSEDPVLCGHMAAAVVAGLRQAGVEACPKHFACNNQELCRATLDVRVDERTLRELYLRPFQICVREAAPRLIMCSYNKVNGVWACYHFDLVEQVLRGEWGYGGVVITDWWMRRAKSPEFGQLRDNAYRVRAGVDVLMPGNMGRLARGYRRDPSLLQSLGKPGGITRAELEACARRVLAFAQTRRRT